MTAEDRREAAYRLIAASPRAITGAELAAASGG
jgi:hypothetical protein